MGVYPVEGRYAGGREEVWHILELGQGMGLPEDAGVGGAERWKSGRGRLVMDLDPP